MKKLCTVCGKEFTLPQTRLDLQEFGAFFEMCPRCRREALQYRERPDVQAILPIGEWFAEMADLQHGKSKIPCTVTGKTPALYQCDGVIFERIGEEYVFVADLN